MILNYNKNLKLLARKLRNEMTDVEICLWARIKNNQLKVSFYRQKVIGNYIVDFYCPKCDLVVELDGGQHYEDKGLQKDAVREEYLNSIGLKILRFSNLDILKNIDGVLMKICDKIEY